MGVLLVWNSGGGGGGKHDARSRYDGNRHAIH
jgi:hypothetical protein